MALQTRVDTMQTTNGATVEIGTITREGHEFTAHGAILDLENGYAVAYVNERPTTLIGADGYLTDWQGKNIGVWWHVSHWTQRSTYGECFTMRAIGAILNGDSRNWYGRYNDDYQAVTLRPSKKDNA